MPAPVLLVALVSVCAGQFFGFNIGYSGPTVFFNNEMRDCEKYTSAASCGGVSRADCRWIADQKECAFNDLTNCSFYTTSDSCKTNSHCHYDHSKSTCKHNVGWADWKVGLFNSAHIIGGTFGSFGAQPLNRFGRKRVMLLAGALGILAQTIVIVAWATNIYGLLVFGRILTGVGFGIGTVVGPLYVGEMSPPAHKSKLELMFQMNVTGGIVIAAFIGFLNQPNMDATNNEHFEARFQIANAVGMIFPLALAIFSFVMPESEDWIEQQAIAATKPAEDNSGTNNGDDLLGMSADPSLYTNRFDKEPPLPGLEIARYVGIGISLAAILQLTGINAIMNYAGQICGALGLAPMLGNLIVMIWNFVTTLPSPLVGSKLPGRVAYLVGAVIASTGCLLTGITSFPGVIDAKDPRNIVGFIGVLIFVGFFELLIGSFFYGLAEATYPAQIRTRGCSLTLLAQYVLNIVINYGFPVAQVGLSGGPSGNQNRGLAIVFLIFAGCGYLFAAILFVLLPKKKTEEEAAAEEQVYLAK